MGKIKMNLDMLEEVRMQHEIAREATEAVINKGRADLNSMTEEVWEGEDGDMAREQLHDLLNKEMTQTWKELDTLHEVINKAQKSAYEAKNFCNNFPQIFRNGSMPSDTDSSPCSGDLMCNNESCEALKNSMSEASKNASNIKSKVIDVESLLAELETAEAKFDYSSYTEPIKTQAQNVIDRVDIFNNAVTKYEHNVDRLDQTFAKELMAATPDTVPTPFDPSILLTDDIVHMNDGDIINFLEAHDLIDIGGKLSDAQLENILAMLFDKKDVDVSGLSKEDFEVAFLNLPEEKQKAILLEMGLSRSQIDSILESKESKRTIIDQFCNSKTKDRINELRNNNPFSPKATSKTNSSQGTTAPPTGGTKKSGNSTGAVECDSQTIGSPGKIDPSFFPSYAEQLIEAQNALCDDDPSNDEEAMKTINECLTAGLYFENKTLYYNEEYLQYCKEMAGEGSLLYSLLDRFDEIVLGEEGTISSFGDSGTCSLTISQLGAGYQLLLNADSKIIGGEYSNYRVAYAATEETCKNYFYSGGEYNWDAIKKWCTTSDPVTDEAEYVFLSEMLMNMDLDNLNTFLSKAQVAYKELHTCYNFRGQMQILACFYEKAAKERADGAEDNKDGYKSDYARALCFSEVISTIAVREKHHEFFKLITFNDQGQGEYTAHFSNLKSGKEDYITAYPYCSEETMLLNIAENMKNIYKPSVLDSFSSVLDTWIQAGLFSPIAACEVAIIDEINSYVDSVIKFGDMEDQIKLQKAVSMYDVNGYLVTGNIDDEQYADIIAESFDECTINAATIYYNSVYGSNITTQDLKDSFSATSGEGKTIRDNYSQIFMGEGETNIEDIGSTLCTIASYDKESSFDSDNITDDQIYEAAENYRFMEEKFDMFCSENQITDAENIIELTDAQLLELYYYTFG